MQDRDIEAAIRRFPRWHYQFDLKGHLTPTDNPSKINRHLQRKRYIFPPLVEYAGGSLAGKRVLDLGCNAGFWSLAAVEQGCAFVLGIDGRQMHVDQANLVFEVNGIDESRYRFERANVFDIDFRRDGPFDIVLFLGLMYHIDRPVELIEKIAAANRDALVIDTAVSQREGSCLDIKREKTTDPRNALESELVLIPTQQAVIDLVGHFGYAARVLEPAFGSYEGAEAFRDGRRRAFLCVKV